MAATVLSHKCDKRIKQAGQKDGLLLLRGLCADYCRNSYSENRTELFEVFDNVVGIGFLEFVLVTIAPEDTDRLDAYL